jgi:hypothetical protein
MIGEATENGYLNMVKWLYTIDDYIYENEYTDIMNLTAENGRLDILKFLHEIGYKCDYAAMDSAAEFGYMDIVQWLHENRAEGCSNYGIYGAALNGYPEIAKWLYLNRPECNIDEAIQIAIDDNEHEIVKLLQDIKM